VAADAVAVAQVRQIQAPGLACASNDASNFSASHQQGSLNEPVAAGTQAFSPPQSGQVGWRSGVAVASMGREHTPRPG